MEPDIHLLRTEPLDEPDFHRVISEIPNLLTHWRIALVQVTHGWNVNLPMDDLWKPVRVPTLELVAFLEKSARDGIFRPRESDVHICDLAETFQFRLCHESDVHFEADESRLIRDVVAAWKQLKVGIYASTDSRGGVTRPRQWVKLP